MGHPEPKPFCFVAGQGQAGAVPAEGGGEEEEEDKEVHFNVRLDDVRVPHRHRRRPQGGVWRSAVRRRHRLKGGGIPPLAISQVR